MTQSETLKRKPSKKDAEQDKKIESLEQENKIQTEYIAENFKNINALSEEYQKSFYDLEKSLKELESNGVAKDELKKLEKALDTFIFDLKDNIKTDDEQSQKIKDLRAEMARSLKEMKNLFVNDKTLEMVKQNLRDDVQRFLDQQKADNEQNNRIRHLEVQEFSQNIKDKNQSEAIDSNKKSINELRSEIVELKTKNLDFQHNLKNTKIVMWLGFILLIGAITLLHIL